MKKIIFFIAICSIFLENQAKKVPENEATYYSNALKPLLSRYTRPFTVLQLWAHDGKLTLSLATAYPQATCIMAESQNASKLLKSCKQQKNLQNVVLLSHDLSIDDIIKFGECEHIDVVIAPDLSSKFLEWQQAIDAVLTLGDYVIIEAPAYSSCHYQAVSSYLKAKRGELIALPEQHTKNIGELYQVPVLKQFLLKRRWNHSLLAIHGEYKIDSSFSSKQLIKTKPGHEVAISLWHSGINLLTFKKLQGNYPTHETIRDLLQPFSSLQHNDLKIFNIIIQGSKLIPIDNNEDNKTNTVQQTLPNILNHFKHKNISLESLYAMDFEKLIKIDKKVF